MSRKLLPDARSGAKLVTRFACASFFFFFLRQFVKTKSIKLRVCTQYRRPEFVFYISSSILYIRMLCRLLLSLRKRVFRTLRFITRLFLPRFLPSIKLRLENDDDVCKHELDFFTTADCFDIDDLSIGGSALSRGAQMKFKQQLKRISDTERERTRDFSREDQISLFEKRSLIEIIYLHGDANQGLQIRCES